MTTGQGFYQAQVMEPGEVSSAMVAHAERSLQSILRRLGVRDLKQQPPAQLYVADSAWSYHDHLTQKLDVSVGASEGVFFAHEEHGLGIAMFTRGLPVFDLMTTVQHECFHHAAYLAFGQNLPRWINEGLAQFFQDSIFYDNKLQTGMVDPDRLERLRHPKARRALVEELIATPNELWFEGEHQPLLQVSRLYASAWLVIAAFLQGPDLELRRAFAQYLGILRHPEADHERAWRLAMAGVSFEQIDAASEQVLRSLQIPPVMQAIHKMALLSMMLNHLKQQDQRMPRSLDEARKRMRILGVEVHRRVPGSEPIRRRGDDESLYYYPIEEGLEAEFDLRPAGDRMYPPVLSAPGVTGEPAVRWVGRGRRCVPWIEFTQTDQA